MCRIVRALLPFFWVSILFSCHGRQESESSADKDSTEVDTYFFPDTLNEVDEEIDEADESLRLDVSFDDFMFAFTHSDRLQQRRILWPLSYTDADGVSHRITSLDCATEFRFLKGDFYTVMYGNLDQVEAQKEDTGDSLVTVERIDLPEERLRAFQFQLEAGKWKLTSMQDIAFHESDIYDFLTFYARFSSDTLYQQAHISQPLSVSVLDPEEDESYIEGTIDAEQWSSFCSEVPNGVISNIRYGCQQYRPGQMVMQKSGSSNGLQELFVFTKNDGEWRLSSYEN